MNNDINTLPKKNYSALLKLIPYFKVYKRDVFFAFLSLVITALMILFFGKAIKYLIDFGFVQKSATSLNIFLFIFMLAVIIMAVAGYYRSSLINKVSWQVIADLRKKSYENTIKISAEFFENMKTGDIVSRLTSDTMILYDVISNSFAFFLRNVVLFTGGIFFLFLTSMKLTLISLALIPLAISPIFIILKLIKALSKKSQIALAGVSSHLEETINGVKTIQSYLCEEKEIKNFRNSVDDALATELKKIKIRALLIALVIAFSFGAIAIVLWIGGHDVLDNKISSGDLSSFIFYSIIVATSLVSLSQIAGQMQSASAATSRIFEILEAESPVKESKNPQNFVHSDRIFIEFKDVNFAYPSRKEIPILKNFNLKINPNDKIAIVGLSGSGKSTILQLLLRFYDVDLGQILINNIDIKNLSFADLRTNFSYISQDSYIFSDTIFNNIAYVDKNITKEDVSKIIDENPSLHFIKNMHEGINSFVGEKGIKLSGGERQRIAFARALIKNSPILLLDEATSALDNNNEQSIIRTIANYAENKTVITVAHKLSSIINADKIIFIKDGEIAEIGSHHELMAWNGLYKKMYETETL